MYYLLNIFKYYFLQYVDRQKTTVAYLNIIFTKAFFFGNSTKLFQHLIIYIPIVNTVVGSVYLRQHQNSSVNVNIFITAQTADNDIRLKCIRHV